MQSSSGIASSNDAHLLAILDAPRGLSRREAELASAFAALPIFDQRALHARLSAPCAGDTLAERFSKLAADLRTRLIAFLADVRRRAASATR